jgi:hypothetical protein
MPRKPTKIDADAELVRVTVMLPAEDVQAIDNEAKQLSGKDPYGRTITRTDVIRRLVRAGLESSK